VHVPNPYLAAVLDVPYVGHLSELYGEASAELRAVERIEQGIARVPVPDLLALHAWLDPARLDWLRREPVQLTDGAATTLIGVAETLSTAVAAEMDRLVAGDLPAIRPAIADEVVAMLGFLARAAALERRIGETRHDARTAAARGRDEAAARYRTGEEAAMVAYVQLEAATLP
jgi:hypothetical protein